MRRVALPLAVTALAAAAFVSLVAAQGEVPSPGLDSANIKVGPVALSEQGKQALSRTGAQPNEAGLIAKREGVAFYQLSSTPERKCFAVGPASGASYQFGHVACTGSFPSPDQPILDFTLQGGGRDLSARVLHGGGIAADGVRSVAYLDADGHVLASAEVHDNVYAFSSLPQELPAALVAKDANGKIIYELKF